MTREYPRCPRRNSDLKAERQNGRRINGAESKQRTKAKVTLGSFGKSDVTSDQERTKVNRQGILNESGFCDAVIYLFDFSFLSAHPHPCFANLPVLFHFSFRLFWTLLIPRLFFIPSSSHILSYFISCLRFFYLGYFGPTARLWNFQESLQSCQSLKSRLSSPRTSRPTPSGLGGQLSLVAIQAVKQIRSLFILSCGNS